MFLAASEQSCGICGGQTFGPGPGGRMGNGRPPCCRTCGALERHRALRLLMESLPAAALSWRRALQFSPDVAIRPEWFRSYEVSVFGRESSLDLQDIARPDGSYDFITLNHVIEFVPDARKSFQELMRVLSPRGILKIGFSGLDTRGETLDYATQQGSQGHYHLFGTDIGTYFRLGEIGVAYAGLGQTDPVTGVGERFHFFSRNGVDIERLTTVVTDVRRIMSVSA